MAYTNPFRIANGLEFDFSVQAADADNDNLLFVNSSGELSSASGLKAARITDGGTLSEATSSVLTISASGVLLSNATIQVKQAGALQSGYLSTTDWNTFNNKQGTSLSTQNVWVGDGSNVAAAVDTSSVGDILADSINGFTLKSGIIDNADVNANAAIALTKLATVTVSSALVSDGSGFIVPESSGVTATQVGYLVNLSGDLQASLTSLGETILSFAASAIAKAPDATVNGYAIIWDEANSYWDLGPVGAGGSITGPGSSTDNALVRWNGADGTSIQNSGIIIDDSNNVTGVTSITVSNSGIHILDTGGDHDLILASGENLTADHTLTYVLGDSDRTITLSGNPTMGDWFDQSVKTSASVAFTDVTVTNAGGLHILDSNASHDLIIRTTSDLTADRELIFVTGDAARTLTINASGTVYVTGGTDVSLADGGTGASLVDPNADRLMFWDDSAGAVDFLTKTNGYSLSQFDGLKFNLGGDANLTLVSPYAGYSSTTGTSYTQTVVTSSDIPNSTAIHVIAKISGIKSDGTEAYGGTVEATFRKNSAGTMAIIGSSVSAINEDVTGSVTAALSVSGGDVQLALSMASASGNFSHVCWIDLIKTSI